MNILTVENKTYNIDMMPDEMGDDDIGDVRFCILDMTNNKNIDYFYLPLVFLESFYAPAVVLDIGGQEIQMPLDWSLMVCDEEINEVEVMPLTRLNDRGFYAFQYNPFSDFTPSAVPVEIINVYSEVKWFFPKLKNGCMLVTPITMNTTPPCCFFVREYTKLPKNIDVGDLF
jgi:hypothetical protein